MKVCVHVCGADMFLMNNTIWHLWPEGSEVAVLNETSESGAV